ncbi:MAG: DUF898 domain-containing protein [Deltaproteobacteria bacterium]|nr:DUF898 domain-containing protein [Deltaproteobacteria bacterium]
MEESTYSVVSRGIVLEGFDPDTVKRSLVAQLGMSPETAGKLLSGRRLVLKKGLDEATARRFGQALRRSGLDAVLTRTPSRVKASAPPASPGAAEPAGPAAPLPGAEDRGGPAPDESTRRIAFGFLGTGWEYFKIWLVNTILSILTLGVYSAWAKVRRKRYLYGSTRLQGSGFEYLADPVKILKGRALVVCFFILYSLLDQFLPILAGVLSLGIVVLLPWVVVKSLSFNARNSAYRNIRFGFNGSYMGAAKAYILWPILVPFTLGILFPYVFYRQKEFIVENHTYGTTPFSFDATAGDYYRIFLTGLVPLGIGLVLAVLLAFLFRPLSFVALAVLYLYMFAFFSVKTTNLMYSSARLDLHRFSADLEIKGYGLIILTNTLATVLTLGLFHPWALIRTLRYKVRHLTLIAAGSLDGFIAAEQKQVSAIGEEAGDFLDIDVGL